MVRERENVGDREWDRERERENMDRERESGRETRYDKKREEAINLNLNWSKLIKLSKNPSFL